MKSSKLMVAPILALAAIGGCASSPVHDPAADEEQPLVTFDVKSVAKLAPWGRRAPQNRALTTPGVTPGGSVAPQLTYRGGKMLENVQIYAVYWGKRVPAETRDGLAQFYGAVPAKGSPYFKMLGEYDTASPPQTIGFGRFMGDLVDADAPDLATVTDEQIHEELARLIDLDKLPPNDGHVVYMIYFPPGVTIDQGRGALSCQAFCAYHGSFSRNGNNVYYGVLPDLSSGGCEKGCGSESPLDNLYMVSSHELVEATTDADVGNGTLAWYDGNFGEIADICAFFPPAKVRGFSVQREWSNADNGCRFKPEAASSATIDVSPGKASITAGASATYTVSLAGDLTKKATLRTQFLPDGYTAAFDPPAITPGQTSTMTVTTTSGTLAANLPFIVYALDASGEYHWLMTEIDVVGQAPTITGLDVASGPSQGYTTVKIRGTGIGVFDFSFLDFPVQEVTFDGIPALLTDWALDGTSITVQTPSHAPGKVDVTLVNPDGQTVTAPAAFEYTPGAPPSVTSFWPPAAVSTGVITIKGANFDLFPTIMFGDSFGFAFGTATELTALVPAQSTQRTVDVTITNGDGQSVTLPQAYTFDARPPPLATGLNVTRGKRGGDTYVSLAGLGFDAGARVLFDGKAATLTTNSPSFIGLLTPAHPKGTVDVTVVNGDGRSSTLAGAFTYE